MRVFQNLHAELMSGAGAIFGIFMVVFVFQAIAARSVVKILGFGVGLILAGIMLFSPQLVITWITELGQILLG